MKITPKIKKIVEENPMALATVKDGKPYVVAVACCKVMSNNEILVTDSFMKITVENILKNNNIALIVWDKRWEGYQFLGRCKYFKKGKWVQYVKKLKENRGLPAKGAILVKVSKIIKSK